MKAGFHKVGRRLSEGRFRSRIPAPRLSLDCVLGEETIADGLLALMKAGGMRMKAVPLRLGTSVDDAEVDKKWKVMVNQEIEIDDL